MAETKTFTVAIIPQRPDPDNGSYHSYKGSTNNPTTNKEEIAGLTRLTGFQTWTLSVDVGDYVRMSYENESGEIFYSNTLGPFVAA